MRDGRQDWSPSALAANANMFLDDFLLFDVARPITDTSHLEIEKSTLNGKPYETGGGRTIDTDIIDILFTWLINRDREPMRVGTTTATKPGTNSFPYFAAPWADETTFAITRLQSDVGLPGTYEPGPTQSYFTCLLMIIRREGVAEGAHLPQLARCDFGRWHEGSPSRHTGRRQSLYHTSSRMPKCRRAPPKQRLQTLLKSG
jgi:hypothetical protein